MNISYKLLLVLLFFQLSAYAQEKITITGKVTDVLSSETLVGANIYLKSDITRGTTSDPDGNFIIYITKTPVIDTLVISYIGYRENIISVDCNKNDHFIIELQPFSVGIEKTVITAKRIIAEEFTIKQIKRLEIYLDPSSKADPLLAVNSMAASTTTDESANISLRGSSPAETGIFFNDVPIYDAVRFSQLNGIGTFSIFNTAVVNRLFVFPSNPPLEYGNSSSGLISIQTDDNVPEENAKNIALSLASIGGLYTGKLGEKAAITVFSNFQPSEGLKLINPEALKDLENFNTYDLGINYIQEFKNGTSLKIFNYANNEGYEYLFRHPVFEGTFYQDKKRNFTVTNFTKVFSKSELTINNCLSFSNADYSYSKTDIDVNQQDIYFSANYLYFFDSWSVKMGFTADHRKSIVDGTFPVFDYAIGEDHPVFLFDTVQKITIPEIYLYVKYNLGSSWVLGGGLRKNIETDNSFNYLSRQLNLNYKINNKSSLNISTGKYHKHDLNSSSEEGITFFSSDQLSFDYKFKSGFFEFTSAVFYKDSEYNNREKKILGGEVFTKFQIFSDFEAQVSYTYINAEIGENGIKYPSLYDLDYYFRGSLKYRLRGYTEINCIFIHRQGTFYLPVTNSDFDDNLNVYIPVYAGYDEYLRLPKYSKFDLSISKLMTLNENLSIVIFGSINNLFNSKNIRQRSYNFNYTETYDNKFSARTFYFGIMVNL